MRFIIKSDTDEPVLKETGSPIQKTYLWETEFFAKNVLNSIFVGSFGDSLLCVNSNGEESNRLREDQTYTKTHIAE